MVRDLILDMIENDLSFADKSNTTEPVFNSLWGNLFIQDESVDFLICNIIIPKAYWNIVKQNGKETLYKFTSEYVPDTRDFRVRLVGLDNGTYSLFRDVTGEFGVPVNSYALSRNMASSIPACMLPFVDIDGEYIVKITKTSKIDRAYIYSSKNTDIVIGYSDNQASQLLTLCAPGKSYRYPTTGVGITSYLNSVIDHSDLPDVLEKQFASDEKFIQDAFFDNITGKLDILCLPEKEQSDKDLISGLTTSFFDDFTDDYLRKNIVLNKISNDEFINLISGHDNIINLILFRDKKTSVKHIANNVVPGRFNETGEVIHSNEYLIVTEHLDGNTIIMFDDQLQDNITNSPLFIIDDYDATRLYTSLVEQPYWITETCNKCFILKQRATVKYMVRKDRFRQGKGLYIVDKTSDNIKNMVGIVQDIYTGRLIALLSDNTNISDVSLDEITQHIYASQITM